MAAGVIAGGPGPQPSFLKGPAMNVLGMPMGGDALNPTVSETQPRCRVLWDPQCGSPHGVSSQEKIPNGALQHQYQRGRT